MLRELAKNLGEATGQRSAVLTDERDAPMHGVIGNRVQADKNSAALHDFRASAAWPWIRSLTPSAASPKEEFDEYFVPCLPEFLEYNKASGFLPKEASLENLKDEILGFGAAEALNRGNKKVKERTEGRECGAKSLAERAGEKLPRLPRENMA